MRTFAQNTSILVLYIKITIIEFAGGFRDVEVCILFFRLPSGT